MVNKKNIKNLIMLLILILILIVTILIINLTNRDAKKVESPTEITNIEELAIYYECELEKIEVSQIEDLEKDIYLKFKENLYTENKSNEPYFNSIIIELTELMDYKSYRLIDRSKDITIIVVANTKEKKIVRIFINGELNYFTKKDTKIDLQNYTKSQITNLNIQSKELESAINNNWKPTKVNFGTSESTFKDYQIYFDEGIEVKNIGGKIYNIVFTKKYTGNVVNNLKVGETEEKIIKTLGTPLIQENNILGYKNNDIYVFFREDQISIYRIEKEYNNEKFIKLVDEFIEKKDVKNFVNQITDLWPDYNIYLYDEDYVLLQYNLRGIEISINSGVESGIILYNNFNGEIKQGITLENITEGTLPKYVYVHSNIDLVCETEIIRKIYNQEFIENSEQYEDEEDLEEPYRAGKYESEEFNIIFTKFEKGIGNVLFISKTGNYANSELLKHKKIYYYGWLNNNIFIYSVENEGIYSYNATTNETKTLVKGTQEYKIVSLTDSKVYYDNTSLEIS